MKRSPISEASVEQREKVRSGQLCSANCGNAATDPAHITSRAQGGCDSPDCILPMCRTCHRAFDLGELDLLPTLQANFRSELAHAVLHLGLTRTLQRVTGGDKEAAKYHMRSAFNLDHVTEFAPIAPELLAAPLIGARLAEVTQFDNGLVRLLMVQEPELVEDRPLRTNFGGPLGRADADPAWGGRA
jgi:hypothetical protein